MGVTLQPNLVREWGNSLHITTQTLKDLDNMREKARPKLQEFHKEEAKGGRTNEDDQAGIRKALEKCINPFQRDLKSLVNIYSGYVANKEVNIHNSIKIGRSSDQSSRQAGQMDFIHLLRMKL